MTGTLCRSRILLLDVKRLVMAAQSIFQLPLKGARDSDLIGCGHLIIIKSLRRLKAPLSAWRGQTVAMFPASVAQIGIG